ncbi:MAG TPA: hemerythrin domain-containing protein [Bacteroidota bacterium]|nr:hemerythrin domain-containing protein [Bacteroidota bacterium]
MSDTPDNSRRSFLRTAGILVGSASFAGTALARSHTLVSPAGEDNDKVSPAEDLMREHGILKRVLLVYNEIDDRLTRKKDFPPETLLGSASIIRDFIEDYHEKLEEDFLFPRFEKAKKLTELVAVLRTQHQRGRTLTDFIRVNATQKALADPGVRAKTSGYIRQFVRMYNPHEAREDTVLFPAFRRLVSQNEYDALGEQFEDKEHDLFGEDGFEKYVDKVADLEKTLGIYDLGFFTPHLGGK